ncbi:MAG: methionine gamma-lyase family protein [Oscillospiraceae bacterium]|nr:methionine gamma-lyase family protein [Oscillospiraceae bacterium]
MSEKIQDFSDFFEIDPALKKLAETAELHCRENFDRIDRIAAYHSAKVLKAFTDQKVSETCFGISTGYGYGDFGRDVLDKVWAQVLGTEDALVRHNFVSGTHALSVALFGLLRPGDRIVFVTGTPYDTLHEVIGISGSPGNGSLRDFGVTHEIIALNPDGKPDLAEIAKRVSGAKIAYIQRSRGYSLRTAFTIPEIAEICKVIRETSPDSVIMVDNCYGEFVETSEPTQVGADIMIGSMIKNAGGGIARTGGYIAGKADLVELCAYRLTCVGLGKEVGCTLGMNRELFQGLYLAPDVTANALKTACFTSELFTMLGFRCTPSGNAIRGDIVTAIELETPENLIAFCQGIQKGSPVDAHVTPEPWDMPGYDSQVIMAAGAFTNGASVELSADAPLREPYAVWVQGGISWRSARVSILLAAQEMLTRKLITI